MIDNAQIIDRASYSKKYWQWLLIHSEVQLFGSK
jgi:hypothetical protein